MRRLVANLDVIFNRVLAVGLVLLWAEVALGALGHDVVAFLIAWLFIAGAVVLWRMPHHHWMLSTRRTWAGMPVERCALCGRAFTTYGELVWKNDASRAPWGEA